jgi:hypothetical protein
MQALNVPTSDILQKFERIKETMFATARTRINQTAFTFNDQSLDQVVRSGAS